MAGSFTSYPPVDIYPLNIFYLSKEAYEALSRGESAGEYNSLEDTALYFVDEDFNPNQDTKVTTAPDVSTTRLYVTGCQGSTNGPLSYHPDVYIDCSAGVLYGAAWNDYAEFRIANTIEPGRVICENGDDTLSLAEERMQPGAAIISDTFGFAIGETEKAKTPIAVSGRVLAYPYEDRESFSPGDAVCAAPGGTVSKMTREEIREYPERIVGTVSAIPNYDVWGEKQVHVDGRIWIKVR